MHDELRRLHKAAGSPTRRALEAHADQNGHSVSGSSLIGLVSPTAKGTPRRATVDAFVDSCLSYAKANRRPLSERDGDKLYWAKLVEETSAATPSRTSAKFAEARASYLRLLHERFGRIDTESLMPLTEQETPVPVRLREVFVPQSVREDPPPLELPRELMSQLLDTGEIDASALPADFDQERLAKAREAYQRRPARPVLELLDGPAGHRAVLLGDPGAGKSTLARYLTLRAADSADTLPLLIELRVYAADPSETFLDMIDRRHMQDGLGLPRNLLESYLLDGGRALVIFDGMDELFDLGQRQEIADRITGFAARYPQARVVVTSRVIGYRRLPFEAAGFQHVMLQDLDDAQVAEFAQRWYEIVSPHDPAEAARLARRLLDAVHAARPVRDLAGNPLLLTILAIIARRAELPRDRRTAYEHAVTVLVEHWEVNKSLAAAGPDLPALDREDKLELLRLLARHMQDADAGLAGNHVTGADLLVQFRNYLADAFGLPPGPAKVAARAMLDQFRERNFILSHFGGEVYGFVHRAFLDFLAAADIVRRFQDRELSEPDLIEIYASHWQDTSWHEVLLLIVGMQESVAAQVIDFLLTADPEWQYHHQEIPHSALLAIRCLGEVRKAGKLAAQGTAIADIIGLLLESAAVRSRLNSEDLLKIFERSALPIVAALGTRWSGRDRYLDWYRTRGRFLRESSEQATLVASCAAKLGVCVLANREEFRTLLLNQALYAQQSSARLGAVEALASGWPAESVVGGVLSARMERDLSSIVRRTAAKSFLGAWLGDARAKALVRRRALFDRDAEVRIALVSALASSDSAAPATRELVAHLAVADPEERVRSAARRCLAEYWPQFPHRPTTPSTRLASEEPLRFDLRDVPLDLTDFAVNGLSVDFRLQMRLGFIKVSSEGQSFNFSHRESGFGLTVTRSGSIEVVPERRSDRPEMLTSYREFIVSSPDDELAANAVQVVASATPDRHDVRAWLMELARHARGNIRAGALMSFVPDWVSDPEVALILRTSAMTDPDPEVRRVAVQSVADVWRTDPSTLDLLHALAGDEQGFVREIAIRVLTVGWHDEPRTLPMVRKLASSDPVASVRREASQILETCWPTD